MIEFRRVESDRLNQQVEPFFSREEVSFFDEVINVETGVL